MNHLISLNESIKNGEVSQTIDWIKDVIGYGQIVEIYDEVKICFDDNGDFEWSNLNVKIDYSYIGGRGRKINSEFYIPTDPYEVADVRDAVNHFLERLEEVDQISVNARSGFKNISIDSRDSVVKNFVAAFKEIKQIERVENIEFKVNQLKIDDYLSSLSDGKVDINFYQNLILVKKLKKEDFIGDEKLSINLPPNIIDDFEKFTTRLGMLNKDKKELVDIIQRGYKNI